MSGGHFKYIQYQINDAAVEINKKVTDYEKTCKPETLEKMKAAANTLETASAMLQRVDWFISCDDGEESFNKRWDEENL